MFLLEAGLSGLSKVPFMTPSKAASLWMELPKTKLLTMPTAPVHMEHANALLGMRQTEKLVKHCTALIRAKLHA